VRRIVVIALSVMLALVVAMPIASGKPALPAISKNSQTLGKLGAEWWTQVTEEPVPTNPLVGSYTHESPKCDVSTTFAKREVFFLVGTTTGDPVTRKCTVSHKAWIFFPVVNSVDVEHPGDLSEAKMRKLVNDQIDQFLRGSTIFVTVDGKRVPVSKEKNRAGTPFFRVTLPKNNIFGGRPAGAPAGKYKAVADGVWVLLPPLKKGTHTITFGGTFPNADLDPNKPGPEGFSQNNTYRLKVV
jgi:hypothetical protein